MLNILESISPQEAEGQGTRFGRIDGYFGYFGKHFDHYRQILVWKGTAGESLTEAAIWAMIARCPVS